MSNRHSSSRDDYGREAPSRHSTSRGSARDARDPPRDKRPREDPKRSRIVEEDIDMDDDSDDYDDRRGGRSDKYPSTSRTQPPVTTSERHRRDRSPDEPARPVIEANTDRGQPRPRPGSDRDFWIPEDGIEREVIQYEITRYLGQDALVRPGKNDRGKKGYLITAFRAPTTEMIRSMKEASEKYIREKQSRSRPAAYSSSRTANDREQDLGRDRGIERDRDQPRHRDRGRYDSDDEMMDDAPPARGYDRDYDRREPEPRRGDRHGRDPRDMDPRQIIDPRYQDSRISDPRLQESRLQDPRYQQDPRLQDPRLMQDPRYDPRYPDPRDIPVTAGRHGAYTSAYVDPSVPAYALSPSSQPPGFDYSSAQPRTAFSNNTPPPTTRAGQTMYVQPGYPPTSQAARIMQDPRTGQQILVQAGGYVQEPPRSRHNR